MGFEPMRGMPHYLSRIAPYQAWLAHLINIVVSGTVFFHPLREALGVSIHRWRFMPHRDTAFMSLSLDCIGTLSIRIVKTTGHGGFAFTRRAFIVLFHVSSLHIARARLVFLQE